jgi:hypothetical protein
MCRVVCSGRENFDHAKFSLRKSSRTLPRTFKALTNHVATSHSWVSEKFYCCCDLEQIYGWPRSSLKARNKAEADGVPPLRIDIVMAILLEC